MIITRKLILCLLLTLVLFTAGAVIAGEAYALWYGPNWGFRQMISIDSTQVPGDLTNFPVLVKVADADLRVSPSGNVGKANGGDILFTLADGITKLDHEIESYNSATGELIAWVEVPFISSTTDTVLYMYYGNAGAANQWDINGTWSSNFTMVYHLNEPAGTSGSGSVTDSVGNTSGTPSAGISFGAGGQIGNSADFSSGTGINCGTVGPGLLTAATTISFWINAVNRASPARQNPFNHSYGGWGTMTLETSGMINWFFGSNGGDAPPYGNHGSNTNIVTNGQWIYVVGVRNPNGYSYTWYKNGSYLNGSTYNSSYPNIINRTFTIGDGYVNPVNGRIDEFRVSNSARSADWIMTSFNNQDDPSSFVSFYAPEVFVPVPTMTEWGMIIFIVFAGIVSIYYLRKQGRES